MSRALAEEIAIAAARLVVDEGMDYGAAKRRAARDLDVSPRSGALPSNDEIEDEVRAHIALFHPDTQPAELAALRGVAAVWMERMATFRPHLAGAVWRGTATQWNRVHIELYCDDPKAAELALIDARVDYDVATTRTPRGRDVDALIVQVPGGGSGRRVEIAFTVLDYDDLRGALKADSRGRPQRGDLAALRALEPSAMSGSSA